MADVSKQLDDKNYEMFNERIISQWDKAKVRYAKSEKKHKIIQKEDDNQDVFEVENKERVQLRKSLLETNDAFGLERILGKSDLLQLNFLSRGLRAGRSVCRIHIRRPNGHPEGYGTGFMISPSLLMTNNHVLPAEIFAQRSLAEFDFEYDEDFEPKTPRYFQLAPDRFFYTNKDLDFTMVAVNPFSRSGMSIDEFGFLQLTETSGKALTGESVSLIQHPSGSDKQIAIRNNKIINRFDDFIHYEADTLPGSSGCPIFNDQWDVVALHHSGVPKKNSNGRIIKKDGNLWKAGDHDELVEWIANEGIRISSIFHNLKQKTDWTKNEARVLEELGTFSNSNLNESLVNHGGGATILSDKGLAIRPIEPSVPPIQISELYKLLENPEVDENEIAPYFTLSDEDSKGIDPLFKLNQELVLINAPELRESALLLNSANWICKRSRQRKYKEKSKTAKYKIISEGDSWFQYPFIIHDVIDHLMSDPDFAVLSFGEAGDLIRDMVAKAEFAPAIETEQPDFFLISGGGNDLVAGGGLKNYLNQPGSSFEPHNLINHIAFARFKSRLASDYTNLFSIVLKIMPEIKILCHGYSYPVPNKGKWLGQSMMEMGISDIQLQTEIIRMIFDQLNEVIERTAASFPKTVHYIDVRNVVPARGWFDELHPTNPFFGDVAAMFKDKILELS